MLLLLALLGGALAATSAWVVCSETATTSVIGGASRIGIEEKALVGWKVPAQEATCQQAGSDLVDHWRVLGSIRGAQSLNNELTKKQRCRTIRTR